MSVVAAAVIGSAVVGAVSSDRAADKAAAGQRAGMNQSLSITNQARDDVLKLFDRSSQISNMSMDQMLNYYKTAAPKRITPYLQGNAQAQNVIGLGAQQANNAILGLPTDMSFVNQPQIVPGTDHLQAELPDYSQATLGPAATTGDPQPESSQQQAQGRVLSGINQRINYTPTGTTWRR